MRIAQSLTVFSGPLSVQFVSRRLHRTYTIPRARLVPHSKTPRHRSSLANNTSYRQRRIRIATSHCHDRIASSSHISLTTPYSPSQALCSHSALNWIGKPDKCNGNYSEDHVKTWLMTLRSRNPQPRVQHQKWYLGRIRPREMVTEEAGAKFLGSFQAFPRLRTRTTQSGSNPLKSFDWSQQPACHLTKPYEACRDSPGARHRARPEHASSRHELSRWLEERSAGGGDAGVRRCAEARCTY